jgi:hypothetical protein
MFIKLTLFLALVFALPIVAIRAQPYVDHAALALLPAGCPTPCFMGIRPGVTPMRESAGILDTHAWVANVRDDYPVQVRDAFFFDAVLRRTIINWHWSDSPPRWLDDQQRGSMTVQDTAVLDIAISTHFTLGEIFLAFGSPDEARFSKVKDGGRFEYTAWYAEQGIIIITQGACPLTRYYHFPVRVIFVQEPPHLSEGVEKSAVCT